MFNKFSGLRNTAILVFLGILLILMLPSLWLISAFSDCPGVVFCQADSNGSGAILPVIAIAAYIGLWVFFRKKRRDKLSSSIREEILSEQNLQPTNQTQRIQDLLQQHGQLNLAELADVSNIPQETLTLIARDMLQKHQIRQQMTPEGIVFTLPDQPV